MNFHKINKYDMQCLDVNAFRVTRSYAPKKGLQNDITSFVFINGKVNKISKCL